MRIPAKMFVTVLMARLVTAAAVETLTVAAALLGLYVVVIGLSPLLAVGAAAASRPAPDASR
jgi:hypothetical protein